MRRLIAFTSVFATLLLSACAVEAGWPFHHHRCCQSGQMMVVSGSAMPMTFAQMPSQAFFPSAAQAPQQAIDIGSLISIADAIARSRLGISNGSSSGSSSNGDISGLRSDISSLTSRIASLETEVKSQRDELQGRIDNQTGILQSLNKLTIDVAGQVKGAREDIQSLRDRIKTSSDAKAEADRLLNDLKDASDGVEKDLSVAGNAAALKKHVKSAAARITSLRDMISQ
jgi:outer membrane murein-binding lipoprotein Lpp